MDLPSSFQSFHELFNKLEMLLYVLKCLCTFCAMSRKQMAESHFFFFCLSCLWCAVFIFKHKNTIKMRFCKHGFLNDLKMTMKFLPKNRGYIYIYISRNNMKFFEDGNIKL